MAIPFSSRDFDRRDFLRTSAGLVPLPAIGGAPAPRPAAHRPVALRRSRVALVRTADRMRRVTEALKLLGLRGVDGRRVVLQPNVKSADEAPGSTHSDTLFQLVTELREYGARSITLGDSSGPPRTHGVMEKGAIVDLANDGRFGVVDAEEIGDNDWGFVPAGRRARTRRTLPWLCTAGNVRPASATSPCARSLPCLRRQNSPAIHSMASPWSACSTYSSRRSGGRAWRAACASPASPRIRASPRA